MEIFDKEKEAKIYRKIYLHFLALHIPEFIQIFTLVSVTGFLLKHPFLTGLMSGGIYWLFLQYFDASLDDYENELIKDPISDFNRDKADLKIFLTIRYRLWYSISTIVIVGFANFALLMIITAYTI